MAEKPEDLNLPTAVVGRLIKEVVRTFIFNEKCLMIVIYLFIYLF